MPLHTGRSKKVRSENIKEMLHSYKKTGAIGTSHPASMEKARAQAAAIAYSKAGEHRKPRKPRHIHDHGWGD
jgi:hypothetical protein